MKKILASILICTTLTGCTTKQVHDKYYLQTIYIKNKNDRIYTEMVFYNDNSEIVEAVGDNFDEILKKSELSCGKTIFTGHTELIIMNNCDNYETLDYMLNEFKVSPSCKAVLGSDNLDVEYITSDVINVAIEQKKAPKCDIITILSDLDANEAHTIYFNSDSSFQQAVITN